VTAEELMYEDIPIDEAIFLKKWTPVPFSQTMFDYTVEEITERWNEFMVGIRAPFPSAPYLEYMIANHPELVEGVEAFKGDYEDFSRRNLEVWRLFLRGDFQQAREEGLKLRSEEHTSELQSRFDLVCRLLLEKKDERCIILIVGNMLGRMRLSL